MMYDGISNILAAMESQLEMMNNHKLEKSSPKNTSMTSNNNKNSKYLDFFIKMAYYYTVYIVDKYPRLNNKNKIDHIYHLLLKANNDYNLTYGDTFLRGLAIDSYNKYMESKEYNNKYCYKNLNTNYKIDI